MDRTANAMIRILKQKKLSLALAESMTCGLAAHRLAGCIGTSEVLKGSIVCYTPEVKIALLRVSKKSITQYSTESQEVTTSLAKHLSKLITADIHAAITGLASPGGSESKQKPVGTVFFAVLYRKKLHHFKKKFKGSPLTIRKKACEELYRLIIKVVK